MVLRSKLEQIELRMCTSSPEPGVAPPSASGPPTYINAAGDWIVPAVCVDASGESYFAEKRVHVGAPAGGNGIGALSLSIARTNSGSRPRRQHHAHFTPHSRCRRCCRRRRRRCRAQELFLGSCVLLRATTPSDYILESPTPNLNSHQIEELFPASCVLLRATPGDYDFDFHVAPRRQFIVSLDAGVDIETSSGERRAFPAGTVMFVEDTWGRGHRSRAVGGAARHCVFIGVPDDVLV
ncbi:hypothetical protein JKP88DRAFT_305489 [Tribonema minus]|uniref:Uncharacterized protein n=1 Tax=Tribonema minus TaxID=303371 RepID=A0A835Z6U7_9STRA|nr:hypothetical protein JKP88DRAFT_305489 [Tribonema minus]